MPTLMPARWLVDHAHVLPARGRALDVACGRGRHALWLAARGLQTHAIDLYLTSNRPTPCDHSRSVSRRSSRFIIPASLNRAADARTDSR